LAGELQIGQMTIAQLEMECEKLRDGIRELMARTLPENVIADRKRLDWLERVGFQAPRKARMVYSWREGLMGLVKWFSNGTPGEFKTAREAIDAAMATEKSRM